MTTFSYKDYHYEVIDVTTDWQLVDFGFTSVVIMIMNNAGEDVLFSFNGDDIHGELNSPTVVDWPVTFFGVRQDKIWIKGGTGGGGPVKVWGWK